MRNRLLFKPSLLIAVLLLFAGVSVADHSATLLKDTRHATDYFIIDSGRPGPVVMIIGGAHGNEPAGAAAAEQIRSWKIISGKLIVLPRANVTGLAANTRFIPDEPAVQRDLNRNYPMKGDASPRGDLATAIWELVKSSRPDWLIDLHEGYDFHQVNKDSVGSTVIHFDSPQLSPVVDAMLREVNAKIAEPSRRLVALRASGPVDGSLARAATKQLNIPAMILETTFKDQRLPVRVRQHRIMVHHLLAHLKMVTDQRDRMLPPAVKDKSPAARQPLRIALYDDGGAAGAGVAVLESLLTKAGATVRRVDGQDISNGVLPQFDIALFSGGSGSAQAKSLTAEGGKRVRQFVSDGGGYVGICAGAYLATTGYDWSLRLVDARTLHRGKEWNRGTGQVQLTLTDHGRALLGDLAREFVTPRSVLYANGPILGPSGLDTIPDFKPLATYHTELAMNGTPAGLMIDTPAIVAGSLGKGRAVAISPHPEQTRGLEAVTLRLIDWAGGR